MEKIPMRSSRIGDGMDVAKFSAKKLAATAPIVI